MSLKLGNVAINKIYLGTTQINKVYLGSSLIFPNAAGGPNVLESFETLSGTPLLPTDLSWTGGGYAGLTEAGSASNVTEGTQAYRVSGTVGEPVSPGWSISASGVDLTGATTVLIDVTIIAINALDSVQLTVFNNVNKDSASDVTVAGTTGSFTLECDISAFIGFTGMGIGLTVNTEDTRTFDVYFDNLRAS